MVIFNNRNLQALFPRDSVPAIELLKGTIWLELNAKLCIKEIQESINAIDFQGGGKWDQIEESNGYEIPCKSLTVCTRETPKQVLLQAVKTKMKCSIMLHFIRVYTICKGKNDVLTK